MGIFFRQREVSAFTGKALPLWQLRKSFSPRQKWGKQDIVDWTLPLKYKGVADELLPQVSRSSENSSCELVCGFQWLSSEGIALGQSVMWSQSLLTLDLSFLILEDFYKRKLFPHPCECSRRCKGSEPRTLCSGTSYQPYLHTTLISHPAFELLSGGKHTEPVPYTWPSWSSSFIIIKSSGWHLW